MADSDPEQQRARLDRLWRVLRLLVSVVPSASECPLVLEIYRHQALASPAGITLRSKFDSSCMSTGLLLRSRV